MKQNTAAITFDMDDNHSHTQIIKRVPRFAQVLELGCADGEMSALLKESCQAHIIGVDKDPQLAWRAQRHCDYVFTEDLDDPRSLDALQDEKFDVITLVDVLEHVQNPAALMQRIKPLLLDEGTVLLSIPNVAHTSVRLELLNGRFNYEEAGILDQTHLRFFTYDTLNQLFEETGYQVVDIDYTWQDVVDDVIIEYLDSMGLEASPEALAKFHEPDAVAYQFIITLKPVEAGMKSESVELAKKLKPLMASNQAWGKMHETLQAQRQIIRGLEIQLEQCQQRVTELSDNYQSTKTELDQVYATRSWKMVRRAANMWRHVYE